MVVMVHVEGGGERKLFIEAYSGKLKKVIKREHSAVSFPTV